MAKILLVEDDNNLREIYGARLSAEGYDIVSAPDGEEALAIAVKEKPDLIITDVMMPKISGFDMLDILRNAPETKDTKIIMMTALSQAEDKERADKLGADLYLVKSQVTLEDVADSVKKILSNDTPAESPEKPADPAPTDNVSSEETPASTPTLSGAPATPVQIEPESTEPASPATDATVVAQPPAEETATDSPTPEPELPAPPKPEPQPTPEPTPVPEPPKEASETSAEPAKKEPTKINVVLPDTEAPATNTAPAEEPAKPAESEPEKSGESSIGPNLAQALAEEEKTIEKQLESFENTPAEPPKEAVIKPDQPNKTESDAQTVAVNSQDNPSKRVIQPINDPTKGPDLESLLAKEQAKEGMPAPDPNATVEPDPPGAASSPAADKQNPDDFSKISL